MKFSVPELSSSKLPRLPRNEAILARCTTIKAWELPKQESSIAPDHVWSNADQDPVQDEKRTWGPWAFVGYWYSDLVTVSTWEIGSSALIVGLSTSDAILIMFVAGICNMIPTVLNGGIGADLRIPFPIAIRSSFGYWFSYFCVVSRLILAAFWLGVQSVGGGSAVTQAITAIWPSYKNLHNHLPKSAQITTQEMCSYFLFHLIQLPFLIIPTHKLQKLFLLKTVLVTPMAIGMLIWICLKANNSNAIFSQHATISGSTRAWAWLNTMTSITGGFSTLAVNIPDFSRFSKNRGSQWWQAPVIPIMKVVTALFGIIATGACRVVYGQDIWSPLGIIAKWDSHGGRFLAFVCSCLWILAQVCCNISANSISFANDATTLLPRWINIRRGTVLCSIIGGWALVPWIMVSSASSFLNFMSGYAVFLGPMAGILTCDYWIVKKRRLDVPGLYDPNGRYKYFHGINWRAFVIMVTIVGPLLPGLAATVSPSTVSIGSGLLHLYQINWLFGFPTSVFLYWLLNLVAPARETLVSKTIPGVISCEGVDVEHTGSAPSSFEEKTVETTICQETSIR